VIYLASPYSHPQNKVREFRYQEICRIAGKLMLQGQHVFSPIAHCHQIAIWSNLPTDAKWWYKWNLHFILQSEELWVVMMEGWNTSKGVAQETKLAINLGKKVVYYDVNTSEQPNAAIHPLEGQGEVQEEVPTNPTKNPTTNDTVDELVKPSGEYTKSDESVWWEDVESIRTPTAKEPSRDHYVEEVKPLKTTYVGDVRPNFETLQEASQAWNGLDRRNGFLGRRYFKRRKED